VFSELGKGRRASSQGACIRNPSSSSKAGTPSEHGSSRGWSVVDRLPGEMNRRSPRPVERASGTCSLSRVVGAAQHCSSNGASVAASKSVLLFCRDPRFFRSRREDRPGDRDYVDGGADTAEGDMPNAASADADDAFSWRSLLSPRVLARASLAKADNSSIHGAIRSIEMIRCGYGFVPIFSQRKYLSKFQDHRCVMYPPHIFSLLFGYP
jgi:hypothetical protein